MALERVEPETGTEPDSALGMGHDQTSAKTRRDVAAVGRWMQLPRRMHRALERMALL